MADAGGVRGLVRLALSRLGGSRPDPSASRLAPGYVASVLWECNLVGIAFARSLHYQFYSWYGFSLPYLAWQTRFPALYKVLLCAAVEARRRARACPGRPAALRERLACGTGRPRS